MNKNGQLLNQLIIQIILVVIIFAAFLLVTADKANARGVRQDAIESQLVLLIDSAVPGMTFTVWKANTNGIVNEVQIRDGRIYVSLDGLNSLKGHAFFSKYDVSVIEENDKFVVVIR